MSGALDERFHTLKGDLVVTSKDRDFRALFRTLEAARTPYALIRGVARQLWRSEPRTTLDIDVAVDSYDSIPREGLAAAGFRLLARHEHTENWQGLDLTPVQFTDDPSYREAIHRAEPRPFTEGVVRVAPVLDLVRSKLRAASDPARRRSKRLQDLADAVGLFEEHGAIAAELTPEERRLLEETR